MIDSRRGQNATMVRVRRNLVLILLFFNKRDDLQYPGELNKHGFSPKDVSLKDVRLTPFAGITVSEVKYELRHLAGTSKCPYHRMIEHIVTSSEFIILVRYVAVRRQANVPNKTDSDKER